jgi:hypothetical protein
MTASNLKDWSSSTTRPGPKPIWQRCGGPRGWSSRPKSLTDAGSRHWWHCTRSGLTLLGLLTVQSMAKLFRTYIEQVLASTLRLRNIVVTYNHGSHKSAAVRRLIRSTGAKLFFLSKYPPTSTLVEAVYLAFREPLDRFTATECFKLLPERGLCTCLQSLAAVSIGSCSNRIAIRKGKRQEWLIMT